MAWGRKGVCGRRVRLYDTRMKRLLVIVLLLVIGAAAVLVWSQQRRGPYYVSGFIEAEQPRVGSRVGGRVAEVHVEEGNSVKAGTQLVTLEPFDLQERLAEARAALAAQQANLAKLKAGPRAEDIAQATAARDRAQALLDKLVAGPRPLEIEVARDKLSLATAELEKARKDNERVERLFSQGQAADEERDEVTRALAAAQARHAQATHELALLEEGTRAEDVAEARAQRAEAGAVLAELEAGSRAEDIAQAEAMVASAQAAVATIERQMAELVVAAPTDSVVESIDLRPGDLIAPNAPVIALNDSQALWVRAYVPENRLNLQVDQKVTVRVDAFPERRFAGHIAFIARQAEFTPSNVQTPEERSKQVFRIKVVLDEGHDVLRPGMSADVFLEQQP